MAAQEVDPATQFHHDPWWFGPQNGAYLHSNNGTQVVSDIEAD